MQLSLMNGITAYRATFFFFFSMDISVYVVMYI